MTQQSYQNFGFTREGVTATALVGKSKREFTFLRDVFKGMQAAPLDANILHRMNPDEILALMAGTAVAAKWRDSRVVKNPDRVCASLVSMAYQSHPQSLVGVRNAARTREVAPYSASPGELQQRMAEVLHDRPYVRDALLARCDRLYADIATGLEHAVDPNVDARTAGPSNRRVYASRIVNNLQNLYAGFRDAPERHLDELRFALQRGDEAAVEELVVDRLPVMLEQFDDGDARVREYEQLTRRSYELPERKPVQRQLFA